MATTDAAMSSQNEKNKTNKSFGNRRPEGNGERKPYNKDFHKNDSGKGDSGKKDYNRGNQSRTNSPKGGYNRSNNNYSGMNKGFSFKDKDEDDEQPVRRQRTVQKDNKSKEVQSDKVEIQNRLEKEKKAMKKKQEEAKKNSQKAPKQKVKPKRVNNIDWTREYENDSYDDDDLDMYL